MALPIIESIDEQNLIIRKYWELEVSIENDPENVWVEGEVFGGMYDWNPNTNILSIYGTPRTLLQDGKFKIFAQETAESPPVTCDVIYNIVSAYHP